MIGGRIGTTSRIALIAAAGLLSSGVAAQAADLGGNCCADLEERVAELEATTARKGNRVVSLTVSGHVNEALLYWDDGINSGARIATNGYSMTRFRFRGDAKINADWSAGFYIELGLGRTGMSYDVNQWEGNRYGGYGVAPGIRHQALYIKSKSLGTVWMGHTTDVVDGIIDICLGCPITSSPESGLGWNGMYMAGGVGGSQYGNMTLGDLRIGNEGHYGTRRNLVKYITPTFGGFSFSASWGDDDSSAADFGFDTGTHGYIWDVALRYAGEFGAFRVAAGAGYTEYTDRDNVSSWAGSASIQHVPTGLYVQGAFAHKNLGEVPVGLNDEDQMWSVQVGIAQKWNSLGKTTFWVQYQEYENGFTEGTGPGAGDLLAVSNVLGTDATIISGGINQKIDAAAMELYVSYYNVQGDVNLDGIGVTDLNTYHFVLAGARIQF